MSLSDYSPFNHKMMLHPLNWLIVTAVAVLGAIFVSTLLEGHHKMKNKGQRKQNEKPAAQRNMSGNASDFSMVNYNSMEGYGSNIGPAPV